MLSYHSDLMTKAAGCKCQEKLSAYTVSGSNTSHVLKASWVNEKAPSRYTQASFGYLFTVSYRDAEQSPERSV